MASDKYGFKDGLKIAAGVLLVFVGLYVLVVVVAGALFAGFVL